MYEVFVWVPCKGWKLIKRMKDRNRAIECALQFTPLEVLLVDPNGRRYYSAHTSTYNTPELTQIEELRDKAAANV